jgi:hypothetical protein
LLFLLAIAVFAQGCLAYRYTITPPVSGRVIDTTTEQPIAAAKVGIRKHERKSVATAKDGSFQLQSDHIWAFSPLMPWEFTPCGGVLFVDAPGYKPFEKDLGERVYRPVALAEPIRLQSDSR